MHERKQLMYELSDAFVALPGGLGTIEELTEIATWVQLGLQTSGSTPPRSEGATAKPVQRCTRLCGEPLLQLDDDDLPHADLSEGDA